MSNYQVSPLRTSTDPVNPAGQRQGQQALQRQPLPQIANSSQPVTTTPPGHSSSNGAPPEYEQQQQRLPPLELNKHEPNEQQEEQLSGWDSGRGGGEEMHWTERSGDMSAEEKERQAERVRKLVFTMRQAELKRRLQEASRREESELIEQTLAAFHAEYQLNPSNDEDVKLIIRAERQLEFACVKEGIQYSLAAKLK